VSSVVSCIGFGWVQIFPLVVGWVGLGQSADGLGWVTQNGPTDNSGFLTTTRYTIPRTHSLTGRLIGATENGRPESGRPEKNTGWKMADVKRAD